MLPYEYLFYVLIYGYIVFGLAYFLTKFARMFKNVIEENDTTPLPIFGFKYTLDYFTLLTLDYIFIETGMTQIEKTGSKSF